MTEYEAASLALQKSALALQQASLAAQQAAVWIAALVGAAQCSLIGIGLYIMRQASKQRDTQHRENMAQHRETMASLQAQREAQSEQHQENMEALRELIRRTAAPSARQDG